MTVTLENLVVTTDSVGAGTVVSTRPIVGEILEVRCDGTAWGATAEFKITRLAVEGGGTIVNLTDAATPWQYAPREALHTVTGTALTYDGTRAVYEPIPCSGHVQLVVAQGGSANAGTIFVFYRF